MRRLSASELVSTRLCRHYAVQGPGETSARTVYFQEIPVIKVKINKRIIARDKDGKSAYRVPGAVAYLDENTCQLHEGMGLVERVPDVEPKAKKKAADPKPSDDEGDPQPDL